MKKNLRHLWLLLVGVLITFSAQQARATHAIGADMNYVNVAPGVYLVQYRFYRDCGGQIEAPAAAPLIFEASGCGANSDSTVGAQSQDLPLRSYNVGNPYCGRVNATTLCDSAGGTVTSTFPNYQVYTYVGIISFGVGVDRQCQQWQMSVSISARPGVANLVGQPNLYTVATLDNRIVLDDASPAFPNAVGFKPLIFTCDSSTQYIGSPVTDADNLASPGTDSLVYSLQQPLSAATTTVQYQAGYSVMSPMKVLTGVQVTPAGDSVIPFSLNPNTGEIAFTSGGFTTPVGINNENNKYAFVVQVDSYRRLGRRRVKISTVRRDIVAVIFSCTPRPNAPAVDDGDSAVVNMGIDSTRYTLKTDTIDVDACANTQVDVKIADVNGDSIYVTIPPNQLPSQASIQVIYGLFVPGLRTEVLARLTWVPDSATVGGYYPVTLSIRDNGCPIPGSGTQTLVLHVIRNQYADVGLFTSNNNGMNDTLCVGQITKLVATTRLPATLGFPPQPAVYTYRWLQDADNTIQRTNGDTAVVRPYRTTRYRLIVKSPQRCEDTASIVVRVDPTNRAYSQPDSVCPGQPATLAIEGRTRTTGPGGVPIVYTYKWVDSTAIRTGAPTTLSNDSIQEPVAIPLVTTRYHATIYSSIGCTDTTSVVVYSKGEYPILDTTKNVTQVYRYGRELSYGGTVPSLIATNDNGRFTYRIRGRENLFVFSDTTSASPTVTGLTRTTTFTLVAFNELGCQTSRTFTIEVPLNVPNIITPNGDNKNDAFVVEGLQTAELTIYNRWGRKVREWSAYDNKWIADDVSAGTYYYMLRDKEQNKTYKGWLEVVK